MLFLITFTKPLPENKIQVKKISLISKIDFFLQSSSNHNQSVLNWRYKLKM